MQREDAAQNGRRAGRVEVIRGQDAISRHMLPSIMMIEAFSPDQTDRGIGISRSRASKGFDPPSRTPRQHRVHVFAQ